MTEFSTNNDSKSHISQPLQNSPRHFIHNPYQSPTPLTSLHPNSPQHLKHLNAYAALKENHHNHQQQHNQKLNQQTLPVNSSAIIATATASAAATTIPTSSAKQSPLHYRKPFNSPNQSPFACGYNTGFEQQQHSNKNTAATTAQQQYLRQHCSKLPYLTKTQHLNDLLLQQQQLLLSGKEVDEELSEESLKQNVAIVLNNLDRYNTTLRSIILNEQSSCNSSIFLDDDSSSLLFGNNNFLPEESGKMATAITPESDYNSNATTPGSRSNMLPLDSNMQQQQQQQLVGGVNSYNNIGVGGLNVGGGLCSFGNNVAGSNLNCSLASSNDFTHDNSDYQWFLDYGYRDGSAGMQRSVLSSLSASYNGLGDLIYYEDLANNLDANLAEVDMESFCAEDIHSLLSHLPSYCKSLGNGVGGSNSNSNNRLQQSLMLQQHLLPALSQQQQQQQQHGQQLSQTSTTSTNDIIDNSICKSELLFSPVKESHLSVDSLDMDAYPDEGDIILTCKANKDNYTIAFEGSVIYSDDSYYAEPTDIAMRNKQNCINLHSNLDDIVQRKSMEMSMSRSEQAFSARARLQKSNNSQLQRYPSGNNNTSDMVVPPTIRQINHCSVRKSSSLPNLRDSDDLEMSTEEQLLPTAQLLLQQQQQQQQIVSNSTIHSCKLQHLLPMCQMPISCNSNSESTMEQLTQQRPKHSQCCCGSNVCANFAASNNSHNAMQLQRQQQQQQQLQQHQQKHSITGSGSSGNSNPPSFNLVKLFIKQKSNNCCSEQQQASVHTCMDVSSGCWPSSDAAGSSSSSSLEQRLRKKSLNDSGKGSALSRHDEEDMLQQHNDECAFQLHGAVEQLEYSTPKKHLRLRHDAAMYEDVHSSSSTTGSLTVTNSPAAHRRRSVPVRNPQISQLVTQHNSSSISNSNNNNNGSTLQSSDGSRSNSEPLTQLYLSGGNASSTERKKSRSRAVSTASSTDMITRSMQTSCGSLSTRSSLSDRFRCIPPSFLSKLNNLGDQNQAPIYVIYPNYALPDLGFVKTQTTADVIFSPFNYKAAINGAASSSTASLKKRFSLTDNVNDEILKTLNYKHVQDWHSLATLLPVEYRHRLKHIPEMSNIAQQLDSELAQRPLFCMTPTVRRNRSHICDCTLRMQQMAQAQCNSTPSAGDGSSSSGSSQQPSSGYRGSSTLLTDSELDNVDPLKQMYVYQYEQQKLDSGVELSPAVAANKPPQPMPRGILRKTKRNSMIEEQQQSKLSKLEKRRSLPEPPQHYGLSSTEELSEVFEEEAHDLYATTQPRSERLSRKDLDARARAENFLSSLPRSELKYYAEIAKILECSETNVQYDAAALKKEVSRALSQQKKVSFTDLAAQPGNKTELTQRQQRFTTPPNSPNISMAVTAGTAGTATRLNLAHLPLDEKERRRIENNPFKRLQIQWEQMSKDSLMLKDLANTQHTKSGGSTPTSAPAHNPKSRIPRPVSYPAGKKTVKSSSDSNLAKRQSTKTIVSPLTSRITTADANGVKTRRSPSRIVPPKRYSIAMISPVTPTGAIPKTPIGTSGGSAGTKARTVNSRATAGVSITAPSTPKRKVQAVPRVLSRAR